MCGGSGGGALVLIAPLVNCISFLLGFRGKQGFRRRHALLKPRLEEIRIKRRAMAFGFIFFKKKEVFSTAHNRRLTWTCPPKNPLHKPPSTPACISGGWLFCDAAKTIGGVANKAGGAWTQGW
jgi:hypothetical protein